MDLLIYQPVGLGDILWVQPIVDTWLDRGYTVWFPVEDIYRDQLKRHMPKEGVHWVSPQDDFPMKDRYSAFDLWFSNDGQQIYMPLSHADRHLPEASIMLSKYYLAKHPITNWHEHIPILRDTGRERALIDTYNLRGSYAISNLNYGTYPEYITRNVNLDLDIYCHQMNIEQDMEHGFTLFDWLGALEKAQEIHSVETSVCYLADKYCHTNELHMYERRRDGAGLNFYRATNKVYRNPRWIYHVN